MIGTDATDKDRRPPIGIVRRVFGYVVAAAALGLTAMLGVGVFQAMTGDFVGGEVEFVWTVVAFVAGVTAVVWAVAVMILKPPRKRQ